MIRPWRYPDSVRYYAELFVEPFASHALYTLKLREIDSPALIARNINFRFESEESYAQAVRSAHASSNEGHRFTSPSEPYHPSVIGIVDLSDEQLERLRIFAEPPLKASDVAGGLHGDIA